jgi:hypothetical protein
VAAIEMVSLRRKLMASNSVEGGTA